MTNARDKANIPVLNFSSKGIDDNATSTAITIDSSERVGIGTTSPSNTLDVNDSAGAVIKITRDSQSSYLQLSTDGSSGQVFSGAGALKFKTGSSEAGRFDTSGNFGIGTSSPDSKLTVSDADTAFVYVEENTGDIGDTAGILFKTSAADGFLKSGMILEDDGTTYARGKLHIVQNSTANNSNATVSDAKITILNDGNVGIGTTSPGRNLSINGSTQTSFIHFTNTGTGTTDTDGLLVGNDNQGSYFINRENSFTAFMNNNSETMRISSAGKVSIGNTNASSFGSLATDLVIGTTSGEHGLTIVTGTGNSARMQFSDNTSSPFRGAIEYAHSSDDLMFYTDGSQKMKITSAGNVGIGTSSPSTSLHISSASPQISLTETDQSNKQYRIGSFGGAYAVYDVSTTQYRHIIDTNGNHIFNEGSQDCDFRVETNNDTHTLFVDGGNDAVIFGDSSNTTPAENSTAAHTCIPSNGRMSISASSYPCLVTNRVNSEGITIQFRQAGGVRGSISVGGSSTAFNTSSDYRLKENVSYDFDATTKLKQLKPARFNWISDETNTLVDGFIAHEVSEIIPEAVIGTKDAVDENGNIEPQGIDQSKLVPLLVKTIQELEARITTLEANNP